MLKVDFSHALRVLTHPAINLIFNIILAGAFLYAPIRESLVPAFGPFLLRIIVLTEFLAAIVVSVRMGLTEKIIYKLLSSFSVKLVFIILMTLILIFGMIDQIFIFFILALIFLIVDIYAIESEERYFPGNISLIILLFAVFIFYYTGSPAIIMLFLIQFTLSSYGRKMEIYDWLIFFLYFVVPVTFYSAGSLSFLTIWVGLYFLFKSFSLLLQIFGKEIYDVGESLRKIFLIKSGKGKYFWSEGEEVLFVIILLSPIFFRFILGLNPKGITELWLSVLFIFVAGSLLFIDPEWWKKYRGHKASPSKRLIK